MTNAAAIAHHEAGHAVVTVAAFRAAAWLPRPRPSVLVRRICLDDAHCVAMDIWSAGQARHKPLMHSQIAIHLAGGLAEASYRGVSAADALDHCGMDTDLVRARVVMQRLGGNDLKQHAAATLVLLDTFWPSVTALANALLDEGCIEGERVEEIVVEAMSNTTTTSPRGQD